MAIIFLDSTLCTLCGDILRDGQDILATSHFIGDTNHHLYRFSDAAMHASCFSEWDKRKVFVELFNSIVGQLTFGNGTYHHMNEDGTIESLRRNQ